MPLLPVGVVARFSLPELCGLKPCTVLAISMDPGPGEAVTVIAGMSDLLPLVGVPARLPFDSDTRGEPKPMVADIGSMLKFKCGCGRTAMAMGSEGLRLSECHPKKYCPLPSADMPRARVRGTVLS